MQALDDGTEGVFIVDLGDEVFSKLKHMTSLRFLGITSSMRGTETWNAVSQNGIISYLKTSKIERLYVSDGDYGNAFLEACAKLKSLKALRVEWAFRVTDAGVSKFRKARPDVKLDVELWRPQH